MVKKKPHHSRREFVKNSSVAIGTGMVLSHLPASVSAFGTAAETIKVALVGCGGRGTGAASQAIAADPAVRLVAMADIFQDQLDNCYGILAEKYAGSDQLAVPDDQKFVGFDGFREAIDLADVVILTTPPGFRPLHFEYAVGQDKHVFMEKPVATDVAGVKKVLVAGREAQRKKLNVVVGLQRHYQRNYREVLEVINKGKIGDIVSGQVYWNSAGVWVRPRKPDQTELEYQCRNWYYFNWICGDHILEQHIHNIDVANWFIGSTPISAQGMGGREVRSGKEHGQIFDHHFVEFTYPNGAVIASQCRHQQGCMNRVEEVFQGARGTVQVHSGNVGIVKARKGKTLYEHVDQGDINPYQQEHNELFAAIKAGEYRLNDTETGANSTMTAILGRMCTYSGQVITWEDAMEAEMDLVPDLNSFDDQAPVLPDTNGNYPVPIPGVTKFV